MFALGFWKVQGKIEEVFFSLWCVCLDFYYDPKQTNLCGEINALSGCKGCRWCVQAVTERIQKDPQKNKGYTFKKKSKDTLSISWGLLVARYIFYGFARYYLRHGVPWQPPPHGERFRRVTVTLRSVPRPAPPAGRKRPAEADGKQRRLMEVLLSGRFWLESFGDVCCFVGFCMFFFCSNI